MSDTYDRLLEFTGDGVHRYGYDDGRVLMCNKGFCRILDLPLTPQEATGKPLRELMIYVEPEGTVRRLLEREGEIHNYEYHFRTLKGEDRWVLHDSFIMVDEATQQRVVEGIIRDITFRKQAEAALREEKERLHVTLRSMGEGVIATDGDGRVELMNTVAERLTGMRQDEAAGRSLDEVLKLMDETSAERLWLAAAPGDHVPCSGPNALLTSRESRAYRTAYTSAWIKDSEGANAGIVVVFRDVTERRRMEQELADQHRHLQRLVQERTAELEQANQMLKGEVAARIRTEKDLAAALARAETSRSALARSNAELERFAFVASHDLQEPLRKIRAFGDRLVKLCGDTLEPQAADYLVRVMGAAERMSRLISDLLRYSRVARKGRPFEPVDMNEIAHGVLSDLELAIRESGAQVELAPLPEVEADPMQMRQLLQNLLGNALKFRRPDAPLKVAVSAQQVDNDGAPWCRFTVRDNGIGFDDKHAERIFQIFQRLHSRRAFEGTGIGLALCRRIVQRHGGHIHAHGSPGEGARIVFEIPLTQHSDEQEDADE
jgi:PAS domain S-box-containing protein